MSAESIEAILLGLRRRSGATRVAWCGPGGRRLDPRPRAGAAPEPEAWETGLGALGREGERELGPGDCARCPSLVAAGIERAGLRVVAGPGGRPRWLAVGGGEDLALSRGALAAATDALLLCEARERGRADREREAGLARLGRSAAGAAHDLRNLLSTALLEVQAPPELLDPERLRTSLAEAARRARDFLAGEEEPARAPVELAALLEREGARAGAERGAACRLVRPCPSDLRVAGHGGLIGRALANLIGNAFDASPRGRGVELSVRDVPAAPDEIEVEIRDRGRGMDAAGLRRFLEPGRSGGGGTGFGTASALACLARVGGALALESRPGEGTAARVRLLRSPPVGAQAVLVADDDPRARRARCAALEGAGRSAVGAASAREARAWLAGGAFGTLLIARGLPGRRELAAAAPYSVVTDAARYSRFMRAMLPTLMPLGQAASHS